MLNSNHRTPIQLISRPVAVGLLLRGATNTRVRLNTRARRRVFAAPVTENYREPTVLLIRRLMHHLRYSCTPAEAPSRSGLHLVEQRLSSPPQLHLLTRQNTGRRSQIIDHDRREITNDVRPQFAADVWPVGPSPRIGLRLYQSTFAIRVGQPPRTHIRLLEDSELQ
jgi:hypothetical protein